MDVLRGLQEGWMEMPELFGNAYVLPAVIVVVLLLVLLLVLMMRKRRGAGPTEARPMERVGSPPAEPISAPRLTPMAGPAAAAGLTPPASSEPQLGSALSQATETPATPLVLPSQSSAAAPQPAIASSGPAPIAPVTRASRPPERAALDDDPLRTVILDIVHGWGDLTSEDTNRLNLFRADKVLAAAEAIDLPKEDAGGGYARTRLLQIRRYAADKQLEQKPADTMPAAGPAEPEPTLETEAAEISPEEIGASETTAGETTPEEAKPEGSMPSWELSQPSGNLAGAGLATAAFAATAQTGDIKDRQSLEKALGEGEGEWVEPAAPIVIPPWPEEPQSVEPTTSSPWSEERQSAEPAASSPWSEEPTGRDISEPPVLEEVQVGLDEETPLVAPAVAEMGITAAAAETGIAEESAPIEDITAQFQAPEDSLSSLHVRVKTAEELMALPPGDQADMLAFLEPSELARVVEASDDRRLKKGVIDVLENLGTPASLDVLRRCLDDPDPEIQLYALDAADRLLGVE